MDWQWMSFDFFTYQNLSWSTYLTISSCQLHCKTTENDKFVMLWSGESEWWQALSVLCMCSNLQSEYLTEKWTRPRMAANQISASHASNQSSFHGNRISGCLAAACSVTTKWQINSIDSITLPLRCLSFLPLCVCVFYLCLSTKICLLWIKIEPSN